MVGDNDGPAGEPIEVALNDTIDIPVYFVALDSSVGGGYFNCPIAINNIYSDYFLQELCHFDPTGIIIQWDSRNFGLLVEDSSC